MFATRRDFMAGLASCAAVAAGGCAIAPAKRRHDPNLTVLLSDIHVSGKKGGPVYQREKLAKIIDEILSLDPLPANVVTFGDLAYLWGLREDYKIARGLFKPIEDRGIKITHAMGNHDRRSAFLEVYPEYAGKSPVKDRIVSVVDAGGVDLLLLDGLQGTDGRAANDMGPVPGALDAAQYEWLAKELPAWKRPVLACSHFPVKEMASGKNALGKLIMKSPNAIGYVYGHNHRWETGYIAEGWGSSAIKRTLCLPSTGHWGDIGYALLRTGDGKAVAELRQLDFYFPGPMPKEESHRKLWRTILEENRGRTCTFAIPESSSANHDN